MLLVFVAAAYCVVWACVALKLTSPEPTKVIKFPEASMVATEGLLLLYVIAPLLLLVGRVKLLNDASPNVLDEATENVVDESVGVPSDTVIVLLVLVALINRPSTAACDALKLTSPALKIVIQVPDGSMVATAGLLLLYVITPLLLLVGRVKLLNDASPNVLDEATENVVDESVGVPTETVRVLLVTGVGALYCTD